MDASVARTGAKLSSVETSAPLANAVGLAEGGGRRPGGGRRKFAASRVDDLRRRVTLLSRVDPTRLAEVNLFHAVRQGGMTWAPLI